MKLLTLALAAAIFFFANDVQAQVLRGGSAVGGRDGFNAPMSWTAPSGQLSPARQPAVNLQQPRLNQPAARPQTHVIPGRPGVAHIPQSRTGVVPPVLSSKWIGPFAPPIPAHWRRDRFFRHRNGGIVFVGWPAYGYVDATTVITEVAPGVIREERRHLQDPPANAPVREPGQVAPFDPTPLDVVQRMLVLAEIRKSDIIYDLGSGDGRLLIAAAKKYGVRGVGFEIDAGLVKLARENARREGVEKLIEIRQRDFLSADLSPASVVTLYLSYDGNLAVREQLNRQLKPGARVVSYTFDMGDWPPKIAESYRDAAGETHAIYLWEITTTPALASNRAEPMLQPQQSTRSGPLIIDVQ